MHRVTVESRDATKELCMHGDFGTTDATFVHLSVITALIVYIEQRSKTAVYAWNSCKD